MRALLILLSVLFVLLLGPGVEAEVGQVEVEVTSAEAGAAVEDVENLNSGRYRLASPIRRCRRYRKCHLRLLEYLPFYIECYHYRGCRYHIRKKKCVQKSWGTRFMC